MNILFLFCSLPSLDSNNQLFAQLINEFKRKGHKVCVSAKGKGKAKTGVAIENGIEVLRVYGHDFTGVNNKVKKALAYQEYCIKQRYYIKKYFGTKKFDLIVSHSLPPELSYIIKGLKNLFKCPFYLIQSDYTWQDAVAFGYFSENSPVALYYRYWEKRMIKQADYIGCPTRRNFDFIKSYYPFVENEKFDLLPFWQDELNIEININTKKEKGLGNKFVIVYGGSAGPAQRVDHLIDLAEECKEYDNMMFVILGRGSMLGKLKETTLEKKLSNVMFLDFMPQEEYLSFLASCDVGMIILNEKTAIPNFPSKSLSYLNMRVPILAALDYVTDFGEFLEENKAGLWAHSDDINALKQKLLEYYNSKELIESVKKNGYRLFKTQLTTEQAYKTIMSKINKTKIL